MNATKYADVLETKSLPNAQNLFGKGKWVFQDNNAPCHRVKLVKN